MEDLYDRNFKSSKKEIGENIRRWKDLPSSWISRINIVNISPKATYTVNVFPIKTPTQLFTDLEKTLLNFIWKNKKLRTAKTILHNKRISGGITIPDLKFYYRVMKTAWY